ncbi:hypothetical protein SEA_PH8S_88 [Mycobacterium phage Ph8s]|nr:hypothetical protein SEA_PH8S_88 [Mycobacterium phage Ph8s]
MTRDDPTEIAKRLLADHLWREEE